MSYYDAVQYLAAVDREDNILRQVEKWEAHKENILHRGFTALIRYGDEVALQHRKHPVFDDVLDLSFSSHQIYRGDKLQSTDEAIYDGLKREWGMVKEDLAAAPRLLTTVYYQAKDEKSGYFEHEVDHIYEVVVRSVPTAVPEFAYGVYLLKPGELAAAPARLNIPLAPWAYSILEARLV